MPDNTQPTAEEQIAQLQVQVSQLTELLGKLQQPKQQQPTESKKKKDLTDYSFFAKDDLGDDDLDEPITRAEVLKLVNLGINRSRRQVINDVNEFVVPDIQNFVRTEGTRTMTLQQVVGKYPGKKEFIDLFTTKGEKQGLDGNELIEFIDSQMQEHFPTKAEEPPKKKIPSFDGTQESKEESEEDEKNEGFQVTATRLIETEEV
jgi:hypothetical protein